MADDVLVLGATGKTGRRVVQRLQRRSVPVRAASRSAAVTFDWAKRETWGPALLGVRAAWVVLPELVEDPSPALRAWLDEAAAAGVARAVLLGSLGVAFEGEPETSGRRRVEAVAAAAPLETVVLRPGGFLQNFTEGFARAGLEQMDAVVSATGQGRTGWIDADDLAAVGVELLLTPRLDARVVTLTGPALLSAADLARAFTRALERPISVREVTLEAMEQTLLGAGMPPAYAAMLLRDLRAIAHGKAEVLSSDVARILGRPPRSLDDFAATLRAAR